MTSIVPGTWIKVFRVSNAGIRYWHHGIVIVVGDTPAKSQVVHSSDGDKTMDPLYICQTSLETFLHGGSNAQVVDEEPAFNNDDIVARARQHVGYMHTRLPTRNCEHFASWCATGSTFSRQIHLQCVAGGAFALTIGAMSAIALYITRNL